MRPEQVTTLIALEEQLVEVFTEECTPKKWPGMEKAADRGDRYWHKKNALATLTLVGRIQTVLRDARGDAGAGADEKGKAKPSDDLDDGLEAEAKALEKAGVTVLKRHEQRKKKA